MQQRQSSATLLFQPAGAQRRSLARSLVPSAGPPILALQQREGPWTGRRSRLAAERALGDHLPEDASLEAGTEAGTDHTGARRHALEQASAGKVLAPSQP